jgi:hypothetical protein
MCTSFLRRLACNSIGRDKESVADSPMEYLSVDLGKRKPLAEPYGKTFWSPSPEQATPFGSQGEADAWKKAASDATGVTEINDRWYVVKE